MMGYGYGSGYGMMGPGFGLGILLILAWSLYWKGRALWRAARHNHLEWFIALLLINTMGILEIAYLYYFTKPEEHKKDHKVE